ncbi:uncharacterized protein LOC130894163 isoform X1 [Diorhabda carinulata]|uniref:uncharacterized protein LOC130894163 isoform X1 n=1 Tax=Diorhabda carinulata TaxID=1163345 RepID=UPI0025A0C580|nr:uncharacterized protein LOC130894163 isoform X1 [Diorhabda carinulata]
MKVTNNLFFLCLGATTLGAVLGAPRAIKNDEDLEKSVVEFLSHDKQFLSALQHSGLIDEGHGPLTRQKRQSEVPEMDIDQSEDVEDVPPKDGFFDRAAKFIVDLLQRFLKWVNSDN